MILNSFLIIIFFSFVYVAVVIELFMNFKMLDYVAQLKNIYKKAFQTIRSNKIPDEEKEKIVFSHALNSLKLSFKVFLFLFVISLMAYLFYLALSLFLVKDEAKVLFLVSNVYFQLILFIFSIVYFISRPLIRRFYLSKIQSETKQKK